VKNGWISLACHRCLYT